MKCKHTIYFLVPVTAMYANAQPKPSATLIVANAAVYTVDKQHPKAEAVAVIGDRIVAVGSNTEINSWRGPSTRVIDAGGKLVLPGFNDAHVHFIPGGAQLDQVQLNDAANPKEFAKRIAAQVSKIPKGEWILGGRWDETKWPNQQVPTKELVDPVTGAMPIFVERYDGHQALANSAAMKLAGVDAKTAGCPRRSNHARHERKSHRHFQGCSAGANLQGNPTHVARATAARCSPSARARSIAGRHECAAHES